MFLHFSSREAFEYAQFKSGYDSIALCDLAWLTRETPGLAEVLDFSLETIDKLWVWAVEFADAGLPGVPENAISIEERVFRSMGGGDLLPHYRVKHNDRAEYFDDMLEAYERSTVRSYYPGARYRPLDNGGRTQLHNRPFLFVGRMPYVCMGRSRSIDRQPPRLWRPADLMSRTILERIPEIVERSRAENGPRLADFLSEQPLPQDDPRRIPPQFHRRQAVEPRKRNETVGFRPRPLYVAAVVGLVGEEDPRRPLPTEPFVAALNGLGYTTSDGYAAVAADLRTTHQELWDPSGEAVVVQTACRDGELVDLLLQPLEPSPDQWMALLDAIEIAARETGAVVAEEEDWEGL